MRLLLLMMACAPGPPEGLVQQLSAIHDVPSEEVLRTRFPELTTHLAMIARDPSFSPIARTRAWVRLAESQDPPAVALAHQGAIDPNLPPAIRYKIIRRLTQHHPDVAQTVRSAVAHDPSPLVRRAAHP